MVLPAQVKFDVVFPSAMLFPLDPAESAVKMTPPRVEDAVTPAAAVQALMAAARFEASVATLLLVAKVPEVEPVQVFDPADPAVTVPHEKRPLLFDAPTARYGPPATLETVNVLPEV
jgi:hypothetical protein